MTRLRSDICNRMGVRAEAERPTQAIVIYDEKFLTGVSGRLLLEPQ